MSYMCVTTINEKRGRELKESKGAWVGLDGGKGMGGSVAIILSSQKENKKWEWGEERTAEGLIEVKAETKAARADEDPPAGDENHVWENQPPSPPVNAVPVKQ